MPQIKLYAYNVYLELSSGAIIIKKTVAPNQAIATQIVTRWYESSYEGKRDKWVTSYAEMLSEATEDDLRDVKED